MSSSYHPSQQRETEQTNGQSVTAVSDALFGTRQHTTGAKLQLPRKVPLRIEPKTYFANERTFLAWLHMAVTIGGVGTALVGFNATQPQSGTAPTRTPISKQTTNMITIMMVPLAVVIISYALFTFYMRSKFMERKQVGFYQDWVGAAVIASLVMSMLVVILGVAVHELIAS